MIVMIMNFFVAILNDFLSAVANSKELQNRDFEVMDHFIDTVKELIVTNTDDNGSICHHFCYSTNLFFSRGKQCFLSVRVLWHYLQKQA